MTSIRKVGCAHLTFDLAAVLVIAWASPAIADDSRPLQVKQQADRLVITQGDAPVATYVFRDPEIARPYFAHVHAPGGVQVTRRHPPRQGVDAIDHATMHPGIWLAFGDLSAGGTSGDFWRNTGRVEHVEFVEPPQVNSAGQSSTVSFATKQRYVTAGQTICHELARHTIRSTPAGYWFTFDSTFTGETTFAFGDQEEMGLGIRIATPLAVKGGNGIITNNAGSRNEKQVWGQPADWCDYSGYVNSQKTRAGLLVVPHPDNFRRSWMHARDYGLIVANPFGQSAFKQGPQSRIEIQPGETFRLRYGVLAFALDVTAPGAAQPPDPAALAREYSRLTK